MSDPIATVGVSVRGRGGDFDDLYERDFSRVIAAVHLLGADPLDAEALAEEAFARAVVRWRFLRDPAAFVYRTAFQLHRRRTRLHAAVERVAGWSRRGPSPTVDDEIVLRTTVGVALDELTARQRESAVLAWYVGCPIDEVAALLRVRPEVVREHLAAARRAFDR